MAGPVDCRVVFDTGPKVADYLSWSKPVSFAVFTNKVARSCLTPPVPLTTLLAMPTARSRAWVCLGVNGHFKPRSLASVWARISFPCGGARNTLTTLGVAAGCRSLP